MKKDDVIATLRACEEDLRARGVRHAALFGSLARGTAGPESDLDILIEIDHTTVRDVYAYVGLAQHIAGLFPSDKVDVINQNALKPSARAPAQSDAVYAF